MAKKKPENKKIVKVSVTPTRNGGIISSRGVGVTKATPKELADSLRKGIKNRVGGRNG
jgi:hypothetical protein